MRFESNEFLVEFLLPVLVTFLLALILQRLASRIVGRFIRASALVPERMRLRQERQRSLHSLLTSALIFLGYGMTILVAIGLLLDATTLVWMIGLFSAGFGFAARPLVSDFLTGLGFIFEDTFDVGEKVEILEIEGVVEKINLRTTFIRAPSGELYIIPNGEVRVIRNFSRGLFSTSNVTLKVVPAEIERTLLVLEELGRDAVNLLPNLLEPWEVVNVSGVIGDHVELTLLAKTRFGKGAETRPRLLALVHERLAEAEITLHS
jgi:small conductance mechanosensitive channel